MPMGTEEEPDKQTCQRHGQLGTVYLGYFEEEVGDGDKVLRFNEGEVIVCM